MTIDPNIPWLTLLAVVPLVGAAVVWALPHGSRRLARPVALGFSLLEVVLVVLAVAAFDTSAASTHQLVETHAWIPQIGASYALGVDGVGLLLVALSVGLVPLVIGAAWREQGVEDAVSTVSTVSTEGAAGAAGAAAPARGAGTAKSPAGADDRPGEGRLRHYLALVLVLQTFMVLVFSARDVFLFYVVFEAMLVPVYFMIGGFGEGARRRYAAIKFLIFSLAGGLVMLAAVIVLYVQGPGGEQGFLTENLTGLGLDQTTERLLFLGFFLAFAIKAPMFPVHSWLPDAAEHAPAGTSVLLVGVLDKVGTFGMLTLCLPLFPDASRWAAPVVIVLAVVSIIYGALLALGQDDLMRLVAYTSVSHFGVIVLGIFAFTQLSVSGASFYMVNHGISTGLLFLVGGFVVRRTVSGRSRRISELGGLAKVTPVLAGVFLLAGLSALSLPGLSTFVSEIMVFIGAFGRYPVAAIVSAVVVVLAALYVLLTYQRIFTGPVRPELAEVRDLSARERWVVAPLVVALLVLGFVPGPALDLVGDPAAVTLEQVGVTDVVPQPEAADAALVDAPTEGSDS
ncbi:NADH dehydrogenase subunit M [Sanguibacter keddieii DSM 10542]|uniref:NADH dehydrogenase subunit M n=1 Tax=Sanguibacter keddieii (strain ATCC 51767 / DSM 10542 / NCFB 3025 / ST-74) TaxID=446469 RepID=D1BBE0_SANKS|nr:NADH-quinone oxidoreductase subunit M [Sanguibacter keddieii]ACZ20706.1 NADH dehydrogenase subunit M [Sanguibacter keddieii DSM 10542]